MSSKTDEDEILEYEYNANDLIAFLRKVFTSREPEDIEKSIDNIKKFLSDKAIIDRDCKDALYIERFIKRNSLSENMKTLVRVMHWYMLEISWSNHHAEWFNEETEREVAKALSLIGARLEKARGCLTQL